jgi:hypothetical protein
MKTQLRDSRGNLTAYAFACGYTERVREFTLQRLTGYRITGFGSDGVHHSYTYKTLREARKELRITANIYGKV